jgi:hypothetical protein
MPDSVIPEGPTNPSEIARHDEVEPIQLDHRTVDDFARAEMVKAAVSTLAPVAEGTGDESELDYDLVDETP